MSLRHPELALVVDEIRDAAIPSGVQRVYDQGDHRFALQLRGGGETHLLLVDAHPDSTRLHFSSAKSPQPPQPHAFVMLLRKHLVGTALVKISVRPDDRIVDMTFERSGEDGRRRTLIAELTGRHGNVFLLDEEGVIVGLQQPSRGQRSLRPSDPWSPPPPPPPRDFGVRWALDEVPVGERSQLIEANYTVRVATESADERRRALQNDLARALKRLRRLQKNVESDLERAEEAEGLQRKAELLKGAYGKNVPRGTRSVEVPDYYAKGAPLVTIELDPTLDLTGNIDRAFREYRRLHDARERIEARLLEVMEKVDRAEKLRSKLDDTDDSDLEALEHQARQDGVLRDRTRQGRSDGGSRHEKKLPYRQFRARSGAAILVGRGAKQNDELTSRHARGRDIWLHARDWAGSHVVLRNSSDDPPHGEDLLDAATLAAHFSKGRRDTLVDVTYTQAKHVRKPKGAAPGLVTIAGGSTIAVARDEERLERLLKSELR